MSSTTEPTNQELVALAQGSPIVHFAGFVSIEDKRKKRVRLTGMNGDGLPNVLQFRISAAYEWMIVNGIPVRIIVLKGRQDGSSTFCGHLCYHHSRRFNCNGMMVGDENSRTDKAWEIFNSYHKNNDTFPWDSSVRNNTEKCWFHYANGEVGLWERDTANDPKAGIGGTRHVIWYTEAARYAKSGKRSDAEIIGNANQSVETAPNTMIIMESTPEGAMGVYYETYQGAVTLEEAQKGNFGNGWIKVFAAWFEFDTHRVKRDDPTKQRFFSPELDPDEKRGVALWGWDDEQIAWRRMMIASPDVQSKDKFLEHHPEDEVSCFLVSGNPRLDRDGIARLEIQAKDKFSKGLLGVLEKHGNAVEFFPRDDDPWIWIAPDEKPRDGASYIAFIDPCTGEQSKGAKNPDAHAAGIIRAPFMDQKGNIHPAALVAAIHVKTGCRWDDGLIAERLTWLTEYYGGCMVVPETGNGLGVLTKLRDHGATIYHREKEDSIKPGKKVPVLGWETNAKTRPIWVDALAEGIREQENGFDCCYEPAVKEFKTFITNDRGKAEAKSGCHDDWCSGVGIGLACLRFASVYRRILPTVSIHSTGHRGGWNQPHRTASAFS